MLDSQLVTQRGSTYNYFSRSVPEIHKPVAGTLDKQAANKCFLPVTVVQAVAVIDT